MSEPTARTSSPRPLAACGTLWPFSSEGQIWP
jgi:hypothetical protein